MITTNDKYVEWQNNKILHKTEKWWYKWYIIKAESFIDFQSLLCYTSFIRTEFLEFLNVPKTFYLHYLPFNKILGFLRPYCTNFKLLRYLIVNFDELEEMWFV